MVRHLMVGVVAAVLLASSCAKQSDEPRTAQQLRATGVVMARPPSSIDYAPLQVGSRALGYDLGRALIRNADDGNLVYSPMSLAIAFAMLREGADAAAGAAIDAALRLPANRRAAYNGLVTALSRPGEGNVLELGNGIFMQEGNRVEQQFLAALMRWYGAGVIQTDFTSGRGLDDINGYVSDKTHGRIPRLLDQLPVDEVMMLVNTVYLDALWQRPFAKDDTENAPFTTGSGASPPVPMMNRIGAVDYAQGAGWQAVRLPYRGGRLSMWVLLPRAGSEPVRLLSPATLEAADSRFASRQVELSLPRWEVDNKLDLLETLAKSLGMSSVFGRAGAGHFTAITSDPSFEITQVIQQANITVGEEGTVAAAATAIGAEQSLALPPPLRFTADHPFAFAIMDETTGTPLFEGTVADPSRS